VAQPFRLRPLHDTAVCLGEAIQLNVSGAYKYNWINNTSGLNQTGIPDPVASPTVATTYTVVGYDEHQCFTDTAQVSVSVSPLPAVSITPIIEVVAGETIQLVPTGSADVVNWEWSPAVYLSCSHCRSPMARPLAETEYVINVRNNYGCGASDKIIIKMQCDESKVFIPSAFTPNSDGKNDVFYIKGISFVKHLAIFDRWGNKVFERSNFIAAERASGWDGSYKGALSPTGVYIYVAQMECADGSAFTRKGTVTLIR
jgi:gliding motility-associated-like protein